MIKDVTDTVDKALDFADDSFESGAERQATLTERLRIDMASDNPLAKMIRPIITLTLLALEIIVVVATLYDVEVPDHIVYELGAMLGAAIGFYFNSRRNEKITAKKAEAAIEIERIKAKQEIKQIKKEARKPLFRRNK